MTTWIQLSADKAHSAFRVPLDIATSKKNMFFSTRRQPGSDPYDDGPWLFLAFIFNQEHPNLVTFHICHIEFEDLEYEEFNPLSDYAGHLNLKKQELADLVDLLYLYPNTLTPNHDTHDNIFTPIEPLNLASFRYDKSFFPSMRQKFYYQSHLPILKNEEDATITIFELSTGTEQPSHTYLKISHFPREFLKDLSFDPTDYSVGKMHLDKRGMEEFASLLKAFN